MDGVIMLKLLRRAMLLTLVVGAVYMVYVFKDRKVLNDQIIRLHVVGASDSAEDQNTKLLVRDAVLDKLRELTSEATSKKQVQLNLIMQTICGTGIRVSELQYFTVEAVRGGEVIVHCKNKIRTILIPGKLRKLLLDYARKNGIKAGTIFISRNGKPLDRSNIWSKMKKLCDAAGVNSSKVFPHNLRKLFAHTFYHMEQDIAKLADILGHGSIETTRIYIMTSGVEHRRKIEQLGLIM